ncbi:ABC transporter ATP-binding protein [Geosporobacter ferrireducens]|uniref:Thiamine ABC transporter permease n=1 Tax=Geosporobacter ferrireducens TaxID=1424294 RepID=A0A1D8GIR8_9FIRM|nr:ABC transporter ATP-binding protein [Geosporobacter ferrireducens]AOT70814.1 thiamine ABC transporter permease [Geosporobacter ferrireducens]MTI53513.1 ABC transporter ATP-binding protein [Geosporobacter ferrireducens]
MIRRFSKYYRAHMPLFFLDFGCAFLIAGLDLVFPMAVGKLIDDVLPNKNLRVMLIMGAVLLILYILRYVLNYVVDYWGHVLGVRMEYDMRKDLFNHIHKLSFTYFDNTKTGHIMSRLVNDLNEISELAHHGPEDLFIATVTLMGAFIILLTVHWPLALITFTIVPIMLWFAISKNKHMQNAFKEMRLKVADINAQVEDSISGVRVVKSFTNEWYEEKKFEVGNTNFRVSRENAFKVMAQFFSGINFFSNLISLVVVIFGGIFLYYDQLTTGELVGFLLYVNMFLQPIRRITTLVENLQKGMAGFNRFTETLDLQPDIQDDKDAMTVGRIQGDLRFENVTFSYNNKKDVLHDISLQIRAGETVALVGPSGGGKTTLCSLIPRFYEIDQGSIRVDGIDIRKITQKSLRENIGIVQQDVFLFSGTIKENIAYGKIGTSDEEIIAAAKLANAHEFIMGLENGYDTYIGERGVKLSGGQKQRVSIARIFLKNPPILILDEATSALDNETEQVIQESLYQLSENRTTLIIAHRLATIRKADRIMVLTDEGIVEEGSHETLLNNNGIYARLYKAQFDGFIPDVA